MATCVDVAGATSLSELNGKPLTPLEGRSLVPAFSNKPIERDGLFWEHAGNAAARDGDWKLVRKARAGDWELHDLAKDRTEQKNLAKEQAVQAQKLSAMWDAWPRTTSQPFRERQVQTHPM